MATAKSSERKQAEEVVDRYLKMIMASDDDAGWQGSGIIGRLVDFQGELPESSGFSGFSKVWEQSLLIGQWPAKFRIAARLMEILTPMQREAVCIDRAYRGRVKVIWEDGADHAVQVEWDDRRCADALGCSPDALRQRISAGYQALEGVYGAVPVRAAA